MWVKFEELWRREEIIALFFFLVLIEIKKSENDNFKPIFLPTFFVDFLNPKQNNPVHGDYDRQTVVPRYLNRVLD
jgi:hypothetical protein